MQHQSRPKRRRSELQPLHFRGELFFLLLLLPLLRAGYLFPHSYCSSSSQVNGGAVCVRFFFPNVSFFFRKKTTSLFLHPSRTQTAGVVIATTKKKTKQKITLGSWCVTTTPQALDIMWLNTLAGNRIYQREKCKFSFFFTWSHLILTRGSSSFLICNSSESSQWILNTLFFLRRKLQFIRN